MLIIHVYVMGAQGSIERTYDFIRNDGKEDIEGCDVVIPFDKENAYPLMERNALAIINTKEDLGEH